MLALYRTYRPSTFAEVTGQDHVTTTIQNQIKSGSVSHAYVFTGPRGIGKTTIARLLARAVNCESLNGAEPCNVCSPCIQIAEGKAMDVFEIDAASHSDVENVRENILRNVPFAPVSLKKKVYIIDEVHMLSTSAFNALLKTLEEPPSHVLFILATTEIHKVPATILSRCQRFDFKKIPKEAMVARLREIVKKESRQVAEDVLEQIARYSGGCERDAESLLGQLLALDENEITMDVASLVLPATTVVLVDAFLVALCARDTAQSIRLLNANLEQGIDLTHFLDDIISEMRNRMLALVSSQSPSPEISFFENAIEKFLAARRHIRTDDIPQLPAELAVVEICLVTRETPSSFEEGAGGGRVKSNFSGGAGSASGGNHPGVDSSRVVSHVGDGRDRPDHSSPNIIEKTISDEPTVRLEPVVETETTVPVIELSDAFVLEPVSAQPMTSDETGFDSIPIIGVDEIKRKWPEVFEQVAACNASLPLFLQTCEVNRVENNFVELGFEYDLYVQTINKEKNRKLVESILERVLGKAVKIRAVLTKSKEKDENVTALLDAFGGSVV